MRRTWILVPVLLTVLTACGGGDPAVQQKTPKTTPTPTVEVDDGIATPEALSGFQCRSKDGKWSASGSIHNASKSPRTFRVTVQIGPAGESVSARRITLKDVKARGSAPFELPKIPTSSDDGPCHVQVLAVE